MAELSRGWALSKLQELGYSTEDTMQTQVAEWWSWYSCTNPFYRTTDKHDTRNRTVRIERMSLRPARMVCDEYASLLMADKTQLNVEDKAMREWCDRDLTGIIDGNAWLVSRAFALGTAALVPDLWADGAGNWHVKMRGYDVRSLVVLASDGRECKGLATFSRVYIEGRDLWQLRAIYFDQTTSTYHIATYLFDPNEPDEEVTLDSVVRDFDTNSTLAPFSLLTPAISNTYSEYTPLGVSVYDDAMDAIKNLDESFTQMYWRLKLTTPRLFLRSSAVATDTKTGKPKIGETLDQLLYEVLDAGLQDTGAPITTYAPDPMVEQAERAVDNALSILSLKCGLGANYFSFTRATGLKTATEIVSSNSVLMRNVRKHERLLGTQIAAAARGAYAAVLGQGSPHVIEEHEIPAVSIDWDDSAIVDTETERALMREDVARGLVPAWLYAAKYYGMTDDEARAVPAAVSFPEL